ncbi:MAG TPA: TetR/AcrR family transcriptional regulator [Tabrizicola sp.]|nr:TetR/AcrR family transcriptional regulator [Tabrizicola sp.]
MRVAAERRQRMRAQLADAALKVAAAGGAEAVTVDAVIQAADVSRGTFYKYFDAPSALVRAVGAELAQDMILALRPMLDRLDDPGERLAVGFRTVLRLGRENPLMAGFLIRAGWPVTDHVPAFSARVGANLAAGIRAGRFRTPSLAVAQALVGGMVIGALAAQAQPGAEEVEEAATCALLRGLGLDEAEARDLSRNDLPMAELPEDGLLARARRAFQAA